MLRPSSATTTEFAGQGLSLRSTLQDCMTSLHSHFARRGHEVPSAPEGLHFAGRAQRDTDVFVENRIFGADEDVVFLERLDNFASRAHGLHHYEIGLRSQCP